MHAKILVVDADEKFILSAARALNARGYNARDHRGPFGTLPIVRSWKPAVVLLDANMTGLTADTMIRLLNNECPGTRIILTARYSLPRMRRLAKEYDLDCIPAAAFATPGIPDVLITLTEPRPARAQPSSYS